MVGSNMLLEIHKRLQQIKGVSDDKVFGGVSILAVGDLYQLPPVGQAPLFSTVSDCYAQLYGSGSLWVRADNSLRSASVLCFCETWLNASQPSPVLLDDQIDIRLTCDNKGGVLICVPMKANESIQ